MATQQELESFYKNIYEPVVPGNLPFRQIKVKLLSGRWIVFSVNNANQLRDNLVLLAPIEAYISANTYLAPSWIGARWRMGWAGSKWLSNIVLHSDFVLDFDSADSFEMLEKAYKLLINYGFNKFKLIKTHRGFHLWVLDFYEKRCKNIAATKNTAEHPYARENFIHREKERLSDELFDAGIRSDFDSSIKRRCIYRLWNSLHEEGIICKAFDSINDISQNGHQANESRVKPESCLADDNKPHKFGEAANEGFPE